TRGFDGSSRAWSNPPKSSSFEVKEVRASERSAGRRGGQLGEHRGLPLERLLVAVEGIAVGQLAGVEVADMRPVVVLPDQHSQRQLDADAGVGLHQGGADAHLAEDQQDVGFQLDIGLPGAGRMVDAREQLQPMRVERLAQPRLDLVGIAAGGQLDHVRTLSARKSRFYDDCESMKAQAIFGLERRVEMPDQPNIVLVHGAWADGSSCM